MLTSEQRALVMHIVGEQIAGKNYDGMTRVQLAHLMGRHDNTLANWSKLPEVIEAVKRGVAEVETSRDYFKVIMRRNALEAMWANYQSAKESSEKRQYLKMILEETKDAETDDGAVDFSSKSDEELADLILQHDISPIGITREELARLARKDDGG